ncbi:MAG: gluconate 2-dehydrogenase subunit 3 family protein [Gammaproteobacteria bacterium]|nr:gluconate 2-dehydrogenase subunit 3 family protein [Gammaproteobacteria bacterium]
MPDVIASDSPYSITERDVLRRVAGILIPASEEYGVPGADDEAIFARILGLASERAESIRTVMEALQTRAKERHDANFLELNGAQQTALLRDGETSRFLGQMIRCAATAYYEDGRVLQSIDLKSTPPFPGGHEVEQGGWSLLDPVKARAPFYREARKKA